MATNQELREILNRERAIDESHKDFMKLENERISMAKEIKGRRFNRKYGGIVKGTNSVVSGFKTAFKKIGTEVGKLQEEQLRRERQDKKIRKRGFAPALSDSGRGIFG